MNSPKRLTNSPGHRGIVGVKSNFYPQIDLYSSVTNFEQSLLQNKRISVKNLRSFARTIPVRKLIRRVSNGVLAMPWVIKGRKDPDDRIIEAFSNALREPNREEHNTYLKFCRALINEILTLGFAAVERQQGSDDTQPFWLWVANAENLHLNPFWHPSADDLPRFYQKTFNTLNTVPMNGRFGGLQEEFTPIYNENLFLITYDSNSHQIIPPGPLEIAYQMISAWLGLSTFQHSTTSNAVREYLLILKGTTQEELKSFRTYWKTEVLGNGEIPIIGGAGEDGNFDAEVLKLGARNDEELYPRYTEYLLKIIAVALDLSNRDLNITDHDNRATSGAAADATFADAVLPMAINIRESLSIEVVKRYDDNYYFEYIDTEPRSESDEANTSSILYTSNIITRNEARLRVKEKPIDAGDIFADNSKNTDESAKSNSKANIIEEKKEPKKIKIKDKGLVSQNIQLSLF